MPREDFNEAMPRENFNEAVSCEDALLLMPFITGNFEIIEATTVELMGSILIFLLLLLLLL